MNRAMRIRPILFAAAALAAGLLAGAQAWSQPIEVYPTGNPSVDAVAIQNAIDGASAGDTIVLKATNASGQFTAFNLGSTILANRGTILVNKSLTIKGEDIDSARTVINGGFATFFVDTLQGNAVDGPVNFETLDSRGAIYAFLTYKACNGASITDLNIYDVLPAFPTPIYPKGFAIGIAAENYRDDFFPVYSSDKIRGDFSISRCRVEFPSSTADVASSLGIFFAVCEANVTVSACQSYNSSVGVECVYSSGAAAVANCELATNKIALGNGILRLSKGIAMSAISGPVDISDNTIFIDGSGYNDVPVEIYAVRLVGNTGKVFVGNNQLTARTNKEGLSGNHGVHIQVAATANVTCTGNVLAGATPVGFYVSGNNSILAGNDLTGLTTTVLGVNCLGDSNIVEKNIFGPHTSTLPVMWCTGNDNSFSHNDFLMTGVKGFNVSSSHVTRAGCLLLDNGTSGNVVDALLEEFPLETGPQWDPCTEIVDLSYGNNTVNLELVPGVPVVCNGNQYQQLLHMLNQNEEYRQRKEAIDATLAEQLKMTEG